MDKRAAHGGRAGLRHLATGVRVLAPAALALIVLSAPEQEEILASGRAVAAAVEAFETEQGHLPTTLAEVEVENPLTRYGRWRLRRDDADAGYDLVFGDYARDGFEIWYDSVERDSYIAGDGGIAAASWDTRVGLVAGLGRGQALDLSSADHVRPRAPRSRRAGPRRARRGGVRGPARRRRGSGDR